MARCRSMSWRAASRPAARVPYPARSSSSARQRTIFSCSVSSRTWTSVWAIPQCLRSSPTHTSSALRVAPLSPFLGSCGLQTGGRPKPPAVERALARGRRRANPHATREPVEEHDRDERQADDPDDPEGGQASPAAGPDVDGAEGVGLRAAVLREAVVHLVRPRALAREDDLCDIDACLVRRLGVEGLRLACRRIANRYGRADPREGRLAVLEDVHLG